MMQNLFGLDNSLNVPSIPYMGNKRKLATRIINTIIDLKGNFEARTKAIIKTEQGHIRTIESLRAQIDTLSAEINALRQDMERKADKADRGGERVRYELSTDERKLVEQVVTAEARDEPYEGQILVCQCILNACENLGKRPADIVRIYKYATARPTATDSVKRAVTAVFDKGEQVTDEPVIYFYAPALVESKFHEGKRFIIRVGCHRFFAEK